MATITFLRPTQMSSYPLSYTSSSGKYSPDQISIISNFDFTAALIGNFHTNAFDWLGTVTRAIIGTSPHLDLDITDVSFTASSDIYRMFDFGIGSFLATILAGNDTFIERAGPTCARDGLTTARCRAFALAIFSLAALGVGSACELIAATTVAPGWS